MTTPTVNYRNTEYKLIFHDLFRPLTGEERTRLQDAIDEHEIQMPVLVYTSLKHGAYCVIDGANRLTIGAARRKHVPIVNVGELTDLKARALALSLNRDRRHLTPEEQQAAREERIERVAEAREEGQSIRAIAEAEEISPAQVQRDLQAAGATVPPGTVTGRDSRTYATPKPNGNGKPSWFTPGGKPTDPDHPYAEILSMLSNLTRRLTIAINTPEGEKLKQYLTYFKLIEHRAMIIGDKHYGCRFKGFPSFRRAIRLAGRGGKVKTAVELKAACQVEDEE